jgi:hypothetical protein
MRAWLLPWWWTVLALLWSAAPDVRAQECTSCWTPKCGESLRSYLPACPPPSKKKPPPAPAKKPPTGVACPDGRFITKDTAGQCCWAGQVWNGNACVGVPASCPKNLEVNVDRQECALPTCKPGRTRTKDGVHCCWPGQEYASTSDSCVGIPNVCPPGFKVNAAAQKCEAEECLAGRERVGGKGGPCCWPGQGFDNDSYACNGAVQSCLPGYSLHPSATMCIPAPCGPGEVRASDDFHCCYPGQDWKKTACAGTPTVCPDGYEVDRTHNTCAPAECRAPLERTDDGVHCCLPGQGWSTVDRACAGRPTSCPPGQVANANGCGQKCEGGRVLTPDNAMCCFAGQRALNGRCAGAPTSCPPGLFLEGESCLPAECPVGMARAADEIHCCWPGQGWSFERGVCLGVPNCPRGQVLSQSGNACEAAPPPPNFAPAPSPPLPRVDDDDRASRRAKRSKARRARDDDDDDDVEKVKPSKGRVTAQRVVRTLGITALGCGLLSPVCCLGWCGGSTALLAASLALSGAWFQNLTFAMALLGYVTIPVFVLIVVLAIPGAGAFALVDYLLGD